MVYQRSGADRCMDGHVQGSVGLLSVMVCSQSETSCWPWPWTYVEISFGLWRR
jgi:hypothetical protein